MSSRCRLGLLFVVCIAGALLLSVLLAEAQVGLVWLPPQVDLAMAPGSSARFRCEVMNSGSARQRYRLRIVALTQKEDGAYEFDPTTRSAAPSCTDWLTLTPMEALLEKAQSASLWCSVKAPRSARPGGYYAAILCELVPDAPKQDARLAGMQISVYATTIVMIRVSERRADVRAKMATMEVRPATAEDGGGLWFEGALANQGNTHVYGQGTLVLRSKSGRRLAETRLGDGRGTVLPGATVKFRTLVRERLPAGEYIAEGRIEYGGRGPAVARAPFEVAREVVAGSASQGLAISLEPNPVSAVIPPGGSRVLGLVVLNQEDRRVHLSARVQDLLQDVVGHLSPAEEGERAAPSAVAWVTLQASEMDLQPGERKTVPVVVSVPRGEKPGGRYAAVVADAVASGSEGGPANATVYTSVLVTVAGQNAPSLEVSALQLVAPPPGMPPSFRATVTNGSTVHVPLLRAGMSVTEVGTALEKRSYQASVVLDEPVLLPGMTRSVVVPLREMLPFGKYTAEMTVAYGANRSATRRVPVEVRKGGPGATPAGAKAKAAPAKAKGSAGKGAKR